jgi:ACR3 family arsenite efflux pump ArsB
LLTLLSCRNTALARGVVFSIATDFLPPTGIGALFGADSPAALATVVGVLVEVPVMLSVCNVCNRTRGWYLNA